MSVRQKKLARKTIFPAIALLLTSYAIMLMNGVRFENDIGASSPSQQKAPAISTEIDTTWRYTKDGWQDASGWQVPDSFTPVQTFELVHPFVWATIVLLAVIATLIWASNESEIAGLLPESQSVSEVDQATESANS